MIRRLQQQVCISRPAHSGDPRSAGRCAAARPFSLERGAPTSEADGVAVAVESRAPRLPRALADIETRRRRLDRAIDRALRGEDLSPAQLITLQARVYAYNEQVELVTRMVDKNVSSVKSVLNTQL